MKKRELLKLSPEELNKRLDNTKLELMKAEGDRRRRSGGYDSKWHPDIKGIRKDIARLKTELKRRRT